MVAMVWVRNGLTQKLLTRELQRRGLGPFAAPDA